MEKLVKHCTAALPKEGCGLLAGTGGSVERVYCLENAAASSSRYLVPAEEQLSAMRNMEELELELVGIFHSHPRGAAYPSQTDIDRAYYPNCVYVIVGLSNPESPRVRAFRILEGSVREVPLEVN
jgi:proteasome lid subunit RPN8/RPN11